MIFWYCSTLALPLPGAYNASLCNAFVLLVSLFFCAVDFFPPRFYKAVQNILSVSSHLLGVGMVLRAAIKTMCEKGWQCLLCPHAAAGQLWLQSDCARTPRVWSAHGAWFPCTKGNSHCSPSTDTMQHACPPPPSLPLSLHWALPIHL